MGTDLTHGRAVFVDDSGDSQHDLLLTAVTSDAAVPPDVREIVDDYYERFCSFGAFTLLRPFQFVVKPSP